MSENKSKVNLSRLQEKARSKFEDNSSTPAKTKESAFLRRKRSTSSRSPSPRRIIMWVIEGIVLVAAVIHFVFQDAFKYESPKQDKSTIEYRQIQHQGNKAQEIKGLQEVVPAYQPIYEDPLPGVATAQETQLMVSKEERLPLEVINSIGMRFRLIPRGTFMMGSKKGDFGYDVVEAEHVAKVPTNFYMGKYEVTQETWSKVMAKNPSHFKGKRHPVENITWVDAMRFCHQLSKLEGLPKGSYRLPTEAEWEYACRGGTRNTAYYFGDAPKMLTTRVIYKYNNDGQTAPVGTLDPNPYGLYNMHGNVWEWCVNDFYLYPDDPNVNQFSECKSIRGGHWYADALHCRSANRSRMGPRHSKANLLGFRVVRVLKGQTLPTLQKQYNLPTSSKTADSRDASTSKKDSEAETNQEKKTLPKSVPNTKESSSGTREHETE